MRRPEVELSDEAARWVEQHPDVVTRLAQQESAELPAGIDQARVDRFRSYVQGKLAFTRTDEAAALGDAWLTRHGLSGAQIR